MKKIQSLTTRRKKDNGKRVTLPPEWVDHGPNSDVNNNNSQEDNNNIDTKPRSLSNQLPPRVPSIQTQKLPKSDIEKPRLARRKSSFIPSIFSRDSTIKESKSKKEEVEQTNRTTSKSTTSSISSTTSKSSSSSMFAASSNLITKIKRTKSEFHLNKSKSSSTDVSEANLQVEHLRYVAAIDDLKIEMEASLQKHGKISSKDQKKLKELEEKERKIAQQLEAIKAGNKNHVQTTNNNNNNGMNDNQHQSTTDSTETIPSKPTRSVSVTQMEMTDDELQAEFLKSIQSLKTKQKANGNSSKVNLAELEAQLASASLANEQSQTTNQEQEPPQTPKEKDDDNFKAMKRKKIPKYQTVDVAFLYNNPSNENPFSLEDDDFAKLHNKLLHLYNDGSENKVDLSHAVIKDFAVKCDINKAGLHRAKKDVATDASGAKKKFQMEDEHFCICPFNNSYDYALFGVLDGHVGQAAAKCAKDLIPQEFANQLNKIDASTLTDCAEIFRNTFKIVDKEMANFEYEGCTATLGFFWTVNGSRYLQVANVGDSYAYLSRNGESICLTADHKVSTAEERARLNKLGVEINEGQTRLNGMAICRSLGDHFLKTTSPGFTAEPHVSPVYTLGETDTAVILASDGLWDVFSGKRAVEIIKQESAAETMAKKLIVTALSSTRCQDNITVMCVIP